MQRQSRIFLDEIVSKILCGALPTGRNRSYAVTMPCGAIRIFRVTCRLCGDLRTGNTCLDMMHLRARADNAIIATGRQS